MFQGRCITLGGSSRRLSLLSTASCSSTIGTPFAPCRAASSAQTCDCSKYEAAGRLFASHSSPPVTARTAAAHATRRPGVEASSCRPGSAATTAPAPASAQAGLTGRPGAGGSAASNTHETRGAGNGSTAPPVAYTEGGCSPGDGSNSAGGVDGGGACAPAAAEAGAGPGPGSLVEDTTPGNWLTPLRRPGSVVALGKFDALHRGHRALAAAAAALARQIHAAQPNAGGTAGGDGMGDVATGAAAAGDAVLLSFSGMAAVLGWPDRLPLTAPQDRGRVLAGWATACGGSGGGGSATIAGDQGAVNGNGNGFAVGENALQFASAAVRAASAAPVPPAPRLRTLPFSLIRGMAPEQFVALLARDLGAAGVVAGRNYRFGYKAAGDADTLVRLGQQYGMCVEIVDLVTLPDQPTTAPTPPGDSCLEDGSGAQGAPTAASDDGRSSSNSGNCSSGRSEGGGGCGSSSMSAAPPPAAPLAPAAAAAVCDGGASSSSLRSLDGSGMVASGGSGGGGGGLSAGGSSRVSSSRIRALLECGRVESVEQLLGRKYRLVCDLGAATATATATATAAGGNHDGSRDSGRGSGSSDNDDGDAGAGGAVGAGECSSGCGVIRLVLPCASYQNQPPAHGQYRGLVQLVRGSQVPVGSGDAGGGWWAPSLSSPSSAGGNGNGTANSAAYVWVGACVTVVLSEFGLEVELGEAGSQVMAAGLGDGGLLLVDFDACGWDSFLGKFTRPYVDCVL